MVLKSLVLSLLAVCPLLAADAKTVEAVKSADRAWADATVKGDAPRLRNLLAEINSHFAAGTPGPLARHERRAIPGAAFEERATKPAGAAAKGAYRRCCRSSPMSDIACVAAPRIWIPVGARAKM